jgi:alpha-L-rhamnosidase
VTGYPGKPVRDAVEGCFVHAAVTPTGSFECSNDLINRIHLCTVQSQRSNIQMGVPTDDTQRPERQGWGGDALMTAQEAMLNVSIQRVYSKWYRDYIDQQEKNGQVGYIVPRAGIGDDLVWSSSWVIMPWYQFIHYGDTAVLEENYDAILRYMNYLASQGREDIRPKEMGGNPRFIDYTLDPEITGYLQQSQWGDHLSLAEGYQSWSGLPLSISTAIYYHDIQVMEKMARVLGKEKHVELYQELAGKVLNAFNTKFLNKQEGYYDVGTQATQAWPLFFGMVPEEYEERVINSLLNNLQQRVMWAPNICWMC